MVQKKRYNIRRIITYKYDTNVEDINRENMYNYQLYSFVLLKNLGNKVYNWMSTKTLTLNPLGLAREVFHDEVIFFRTIWTLIRIGDEFRKMVLTILTCLTFIR